MIKNAARVSFDYDRIELYDEEHSVNEDRYDTIGDSSAGNLRFNRSVSIIGELEDLGDN